MDPGNQALDQGNDSRLVRLLFALTAALTTALLASGCRLPGQRGPVPETLATSRQLTQQGVAAQERGHSSEALGKLAEAVEICPIDPDARRHYAEALWDAGSQSEATAQMAEAARLTPEDVLVQVRLAEMHLAMGQLVAAADAADAALDRNPKLAAAWTIRGRVMQRMKRPRRALADFHRALSFAPEDRDVLLAVAELYRSMNQPHRALAALNSLAETYPPGEEPQHVLHLQGMAYVAAGRFDDAAESYRTAMARRAPDAELLCHLAQAEALAGRTREAAATARQALSLDPEHRPSHDLLDRLRVAHDSAPPRR